MSQTPIEIVEEVLTGIISAAGTVAAVFPVAAPEAIAVGGLAKIAQVVLEQVQAGTLDAAKAQAAVDAALATLGSALKDMDTALAEGDAETEAAIKASP